MEKVVVEINKIDQKSPTQQQRPTNLELLTSTSGIEKLKKEVQNLDEIVTMDDNNMESSLPVLIKQNGAQLSCQRQNSEENSVFFNNLRRAFCCLRTRRSS